MTQKTTHHPRMIGILLLVISMFTGLLGAGMVLPAPIAQASQADGVDTLTSDMVDGVTIQIKHVNDEDWRPLPDDGTGVISVFDQLRYNLDFHIPQGTLNSTKTLTIWPQLNGEVHGWLGTSTNQSWHLNGNIMIGGQEAGTYTIESGACTYRNSRFQFAGYNSTYNYCPALMSDDGFQNRYMIRINLTFNQEFCDRNKTMDITDGQLYYDQDAHWLGGGNETVTVSFAGHETALRLVAPTVELSKQAVGNPVYDRKNGQVRHQWKITVTNTGEYEIPAGWRMHDQIFDDEIPLGADLQSSSFYNGWFQKRTLKISSDAGVKANSSGYVTNNYGSSTSSVNGVTYYRTQYSTMSALPPGGTVTFEFTSILPMDTTPDRYVNRAVLTSKYVAPLAASAEQPNPAKGEPNLKITKSNNGDPTGKNADGDCTLGDDGCIARIPWQATISNVGDGDLAAGWQIVDELSYSYDASLSGHKFDKTDITLMQDGLLTKGYASTVAQVNIAGNAEATLNGWQHVPNGDLDAFEYTGRIVGVKLTMDTPLKAGASFTHTYWTSDDWGPTGNVVKTKGGSYRNTAKACGWLGNEGNREWFCWTSNTPYSTQIYGQYQVKDCGSAAYDYARKPDAPFAFCTVYGNRISQDAGKPMVFHESTRSKYYSNYDRALNNITGFVLKSLDRNSLLKLESPQLSGVEHAVASDVFAGSSGEPMRIVKTGEGEWDIMFPADWQWSKMGRASNAVGSDTFSFSISYYPRHVPGWTDYTSPIWYVASDEDSSNICGNGSTGKVPEGQARYVLCNTVHGKITNGLYDFTSRSYARQDVYPRSSVKNRYAQNPDGARGTRVTYRITGNWLAGDMNPNGNTVGITDTVSIPDDASANLKEGSIRVWAANSSYDLQFCAGTPSTGNTACWAGYYSNNQYKLDPSSYTVRYDTAGHTLTIDGLPDNKVLWIEYDIVFNSTADTIPNVKNTVTFTASGKPNQLVNPATTTSTITIYQSAAVAKIQGVYLKKTDSTDSALVLADAEFDLHRWDGTRYVLDRHITTNNTAASVIDKLECGTAYRLTETQAPDGYQLDTSPYDFALKACEAPTNLKPDNWYGVEHITMDTITRTNQPIPMKHAMPMTGNGQWLIILLGISLATMIGGIVILMRTSRQ